MKTLYNQVTDILRNVLDVQEEQIKDNSKFVEDLGADSLTIVEIIMEVEEEFDIVVPDNEAEFLLTVKDLRDYVEDKTYRPILSVTDLKERTMATYKGDKNND